MSYAAGNWYQDNQRYLLTALDEVKKVLEAYHGRTDSSHGSATPVQHDLKDALKDVSADMVPPALVTLCRLFGLSPFERAVLLLCAGMELDSTFAQLCAAAQGDPVRTYPTFSLALAALPDPHWSALTPAAPLRRWRMIEAGSGSTLTLSPLRIDERVLHYLTGVQHLDERLVGIVHPLYVSEDLVPSHLTLAEKLSAIWSNAVNAPILPVVQLYGDEVEGKRAIAAAACAMLGLNLNMISANFIPAAPGELDALIRLWEREAALGASALLLDCDDIDAADAVRERAINRFIECIRSWLIITSYRPRRMRQRPTIDIEVRKPTPGEQRSIWENVLGHEISGLNGNVEALVSQFNLSAQTIRSASAQASGCMSSKHRDDFGKVLWDACRVHARPHLNDLAQHIEYAATWDDLVLPEPQRQTLREIAMHIRQREKVYTDWGFATKGTRGLGINALFSGASGTGKTMVAEILANELRLDLYRIDLSQVVSKYIGETEKNLRQVFDAAEGGGAILLFDEADALFGKRGEIRDSHDRYANIEVSYLLQRMEAYRGLAILTTNMKEALDPAFLRRIRFIVQFPFPDAAQRAQIWQRMFPSSTPTDGLNVSKLARLNVAGGNIRNIALNAAFLAADAGEPVRMTHILRSARSEYAKLERPLTDAEIGGWV